MNKSGFIPQNDKANFMVVTEKPVSKTNRDGIIVDFSGIIEFTGDNLFDFCTQNRELRIEKTKEGKLSIMLPMGGEGSEKEGTLFYFVKHWGRKNKLGKIFSPSAGFNLPGGAMRSPDVAYITKERWKSISLVQRKKFPPLCPDFVAELRSESDSLEMLKEKMDEWMENGCRLAWLIDPLEEKAYIYRLNKEIEEVSSFNNKLLGEDVLPIFELDLKEFLDEENHYHSGNYREI